MPVKKPKKTAKTKAVAVVNPAPKKPQPKTHRKKKEMSKVYSTFLAALAQTGNVRASAEAADVNFSIIYAHRRENPAFKAAFDEALAMAVESLEGEAFRRALDGTLKPVYQGGEQVGTIREYSDTLLIFLLKGRKKEVYGDTLKHQGDAENPLLINADNLTREEILAEIKSRSERLGLAELLKPVDTTGN